MKLDDTHMDGKGGLDACPDCGGSLTEIERDFIDYDALMLRMRCNDCGDSFAEWWQAIGYDRITEDITPAKHASENNAGQ